ncbi:hypothetical protein L6Q79_16180, partial [bacterium]|nr:hypothetical protein [bacterium]
MGKVLGIDLGTNSIGWAIVEDSSRILGMGSRVFKEGVNKDTSGKEVSKSAARRAARGARRGYYRRRMRKARLKKLLEELGLTPDKNLYTSE